MDGQTFARIRGNGLAFDPSTHEDSVGQLKSPVIKRSIMIAGHRTSISLEDVFWNTLRSIARDRDLFLSELVGRIDAERQHSNLSSAIRQFVVEYLQSKDSRGGA